MKIADHPLTKLIDFYTKQYPSFREENLDYPNVSFHRKFGLFLQCPAGWPVLEAANKILEISDHSLATAVIFSSTDSYRNIHTLMGDKVKYFSWHEVFTGMQVASTDIRYVQRIKSVLTDAALTFFIDPPVALPEVIDQVRSHTTGCLIILSRNDGEK